VEVKALRGVPWTILGFAFTKAVGVGTTILLARLLVPSDFGIVALATLFVECVSYVAGLGLGPAFVVRHDLGPRGPGTALSLMLVLGVLSGGVLALAAPFVGPAFEESRLTTVLLVLAFLSPLNALSSFYTTLNQRDLEFRRAFAAHVTRTVVYAAVALILAANSAGIWSLVGGVAASTAAHCVALLLLTPRRVSPALDRVASRKLCSTGVDFVVQSSVSFVQQNVDYVAIGWALGSTKVGLYSMAFRLSELPYYAIADPVAEVTFPGFARMHTRGEAVERAFLRILQTVALASVPFGLVLAATAEPFTELVLGERWLGMVGALEVLGIWGSLRPLQTMSGWLLNSVGHSRLVGKLSLGVNVLQVPAVVVAVVLADIEAVAWTMLAGLLVFLGTLVWSVRQRLGIGARAQWGAVRAAVAAGAPTWVAARLVASFAEDVPAAATLVLAALAGFATYVAVVAILEPGLLQRVVGDVWRIVLRPAPAPPPEPALPAPMPPESHTQPH
jgi:lipopolysaccharide exporter